MRHLLLRNAVVVDGTGAPGRSADVEVRDGRITAIGRLGPVDAAEEVDLAGLVLCPGFIDIHTHFDAQLFWDSRFTPSTWHGVTTVVIGNCGFGIAPTRPADRDAVMETLELVEGMNPLTLRTGIEWGFETFPEYLDEIRRRPKALNVAAFVPHSTIRTYAMGPEASATRAATEDEVAHMQRLVREAMDAGAIGVSTSQAPSHVGWRGLPVPSRLADPGEIRALLDAMAASGRGIAEITYGPAFEIDEVARLSSELGVPITWGSLLTGLFGGPGAALELLERACAVPGAQIWPQVHCREIVFQMTLESPYYFGQVPAFEEALALPRDQRARIYADSAWRDRARPDILGVRPGAYDRISVEETVAHAELRGRSLAAVAAEREVHPFDLLLDLAIDEDLGTRFRIVSRNEDPVELRALLTDDRTVLGAHDAGAHIDMICDSCFPSHLLGHWVRAEQAMTLEHAVWRMTGQPA
ncbi:MAG: amidohydrolase family protein, partial [Acidimicrobiales bacterium]|nr:amidohydrolase family protein [Acidimicrobiales bacterium]